MDHLMTHSTLAAGSDIFDLIIPLVFIAVAVIGSLAKTAKQAKKTVTKTRGRLRGSSAGPSGPTLDKRLDELAKRRRQQLQALVQHRQKQSAAKPKPTRTPASTASARHDPSMDMEQSVQQHLEEIARRRRASELAGQQRRQTHSEQRAEAIAARERQAELERQRKRAERMAVHEDRHGEEISEVHRHVRDASKEAAPSRSLSYWREHLQVNRREAMRQAVILKELLDRPVGLREPGWQIGGDL